MRRFLLLALCPLVLTVTVGCGDDAPKPMKPNDTKGEGVGRYRPGDEKGPGNKGVPKGAMAATKD